MQFLFRVKWFQNWCFTRVAVKSGVFRACFEIQRVTGSCVHTAGVIAVSAKCYVVTFVVEMGLRHLTHFTIDY